MQIVEITILVTLCEHCCDVTRTELQVRDVSARQTTERFSDRKAQHNYSEGNWVPRLPYYMT